MAFNNYLYILPLLMAILIPSRNFSKLIHLGGKRADFFKSAILTYLLVSSVIALLAIILEVSVGKINGDVNWLLSLLEVFGFMEHGIIVAFFQMSAFLLLFCCVLHTLTLAQGHWYGWLTDILIVAIISIFTPIAPLRGALVWFFNIIIFHHFAIVQILSCVVLSAVVYSASLISIKSEIL
jgi:hypothetical protein